MFGIRKIQNKDIKIYARAKEGEYFTDLMGLILSRENILLAYRNIKANTGSNTPGTDKVTVKAKLFCPEIAGLFCRIAGLFCHDSRANLSLKPVCFGIAIS